MTQPEGGSAIFRLTLSQEDAVHGDVTVETFPNQSERYQSKGQPDGMDRRSGR